MNKKNKRILNICALTLATATLITSCSIIGVSVNQYQAITTTTNVSTHSNTTLTAYLNDNQTQLNRNLDNKNQSSLLTPSQYGYNRDAQVFFIIIGICGFIGIVAIIFIILLMTKLIGEAVNKNKENKKKSKSK